MHLPSGWPGFDLTEREVVKLTGGFARGVIELACKDFNTLVHSLEKVELAQMNNCNQ